MNSGIVLEFVASCSGSFAWPGSHTSLAIDKDATVEVVLATRATSVLPACVCYLAHLGPHLYSKGSCVRITTLRHPPARRV